MTEKKQPKDNASVAYEMARMLWEAEHGAGKEPKFEDAPKFLKIVKQCSLALRIDGMFQPETAFSE